MNRLNEKAVVRALFPFGQQHVDKLRDRIEDKQQSTSDKRQFINIWHR